MMNEIYLSGRIMSDLDRGNYPDGTPVVTFRIFESYKGNDNIFKIIVSGKSVEYCKDLKKGMMVYLKGHVSTGMREVKDAKVIKNGKENGLFVPVFEIKAYEISISPFSVKEIVA